MIEVYVEAAAGAEPPLLRAALEAAIRLGLDAPERPLALGLQPVLEVNLLLTDDARIRQLNRDYRGLDRPTDVLSFSQIEQIDGEAGFVPAPSGRLVLGDVIVSIETARRQAADQGHGLEAEVRHLAVHGALHLLGYDHQTDEEEARMNRLAQQALAVKPAE